VAKDHHLLRLTLRTLLAYLDDTLQPNEIKIIGQKVAESDAAQELIERIKQTTRRRRLTVPPVNGPNPRFDANTVAEYLDNELSPEEMVDVEKVCLESDTHLAEIAACHQILTLVLGEPALVPPTARDRMYKLVQGKEAAASRKPTPRPVRSTVPDEEEGETESGPLVRWLLPASVFAAFVVLGLLVWQFIPPRSHPPIGPDLTNQVNPDQPLEAKIDKKDTTTEKKDPESKKEVVPEPKQDPGPKKDPTPEPKKDTERSSTPGIAEPVTPDRPAAPNMDREPIGRYIGAEGNYPSILVHRDKTASGESWFRIGRGKTVSSGEPLVCLPGFISEINTNGGVRVVQRGHLREFNLFDDQDYLMDSTVILHPNAAFDLDLTVERGRLYLENIKEKGPANIRLRFANEVWDLSLLNLGDQVVIDLLKDSSGVDYKAGDPPAAKALFCLLHGEAKLRIDTYHTYTLSEGGPVLFKWDNISGRAVGPAKFDSLSLWKKEHPNNELANSMFQAVKTLDGLVKDKIPLETALQNSLDQDRRESKLLALYSFAAIDDLNKLIDTLSDEDPRHFLERDTAIFSLRRWLSHGAGQAAKLYDEKTQMGLLRSKGYTAHDAEIIVTLLHTFKSDDRRSPETFELLADYLRSKKVCVATLAYWHLLRMSFPEKLPPFDGTMPLERREEVSQQVKDMVAKKKLPPMPRGEAPKAPGGR
jgi:hypothetical protein